MNVFVCKVLFPLRYAQKQYVREQVSGEKHERPYIYKPTATSSGGPTTTDGKPPTTVCQLCFTSKYWHNVYIVVTRIIRPRRSRNTAAYSDQTFRWTICRSVGPYVHRSVGLGLEGCVPSPEDFLIFAS